jgi:hypothetical protein
MNQVRGLPAAARRSRAQRPDSRQGCRAGDTAARMRFACGAARRHSVIVPAYGYC